MIYDHSNLENELRALADARGYPMSDPLIRAANTLAKLRAALAPFAEYEVRAIFDTDSAWELRVTKASPQPIFKHFDDARAALKQG